MQIVGFNKMTPKEVAEATGKSESAALKALQRMYDKELLTREDGKYYKFELYL